MAVKLQVRNGLASEWTTHNPILMVGELGVEIDTDKWKIGNGIDDWNTRPYAPQGQRGEVGPPVSTVNNLEEIVPGKALDAVQGKALKEGLDIVTTQSNEMATDITNKAIVESGKNENGSYVKFGDGTQICYSDLLENVATNTQIPYPSNFSKKPIVTFISEDRNRHIRNGASGSTSILFLITVNDSGSGASITKGSYIAIGRWKA